MTRPAGAHPPHCAPGAFPATDRERLDDDERRNQLRRVLDREIDNLCKQAFDEARERQEEPYEVLWETLDSHQWVIYTAYNHHVLAQSRNDGYAVDNWGADGIVEDGCIRWDRLAFGAMLGDCLETAEYDWNEIPEAETEDAEA